MPAVAPVHDVIEAPDVVLHSRLAGRARRQLCHRQRHPSNKVKRDQKTSPAYGTTRHLTIKGPSETVADILSGESMFSLPGPHLAMGARLPVSI